MLVLFAVVFTSRGDAGRKLAPWGLPCDATLNSIYAFYLALFNSYIRKCLFLEGMNFSQLYFYFVRTFFGAK